MTKRSLIAMDEILAPNTIGQLMDALRLCFNVSDGQPSAWANTGEAYVKLALQRRVELRTLLCDAAKHERSLIHDLWDVLSQYAQNGRRGNRLLWREHPEITLVGVNATEADMQIRCRLMVTSQPDLVPDNYAPSAPASAPPPLTDHQQVAIAIGEGFRDLCKRAWGLGIPQPAAVAPQVAKATPASSGERQTTHKLGDWGARLAKGTEPMSVMVVVPEEPTSSMVLAAIGASDVNPTYIRSVWRSMVQQAIRDHRSGAK